MCTLRAWQLWQQSRHALGHRVALVLVFTAMFCGSGCHAYNTTALAQVAQEEIVDVTPWQEQDPHHGPIFVSSGAP